MEAETLDLDGAAIIAPGGEGPGIVGRRDRAHDGALEVQGGDLRPQRPRFLTFGNPGAGQPGGQDDAAKLEAKNDDGGEMVGIGPAAQIRANRRRGDFDAFPIALVQGLDAGGVEGGGDGLGSEFEAAERMGGLDREPDRRPLGDERYKVAAGKIDAVDTPRLPRQQPRLKHRRAPFPGRRAIGAADHRIGHAGMEEDGKSADLEGTVRERIAAGAPIGGPAFDVAADQAGADEPQRGERRRRARQGYAQTQNPAPSRPLHRTRLAPCSYRFPCIVAGPAPVEGGKGRRSAPKVG